MKIIQNEISISAVELVEILRRHLHELYPKTRQILPESEEDWHIEATTFSYCADMGKEFEKRAKRAKKADNELVEEVCCLNLYVDNVDGPRDIPQGPAPSMFDVKAFGGS